MSCNHCSTKFNFFHKEMGCSNCGLSFCSKCLKQKCKVPSKGSGEYSVCKHCFNTLNSASTASSTPVPPPDIFLKRISSLENNASSQAPITVNRRLEPANRLSAADQKLVERLEKLKDKPANPPPSESELRSRLALLKGVNNYVEGPSRPKLEPPPQTADSLLEQFINEETIELNRNRQEEIEARIVSLREQGVRPNEGPYVANLHDSDDGSSGGEEVDKITKKIMDEVALEEKCSQHSESKKIIEKSKSNSLEAASGTPELPWCVLCNNDAKFRCYDCSNDLYCAQCNLEVHQNWGDTDHKVVTYKQP